MNNLASRQLGRVVWGGDVERYHTMRTIRTETVHHHTAVVAHIVDLILPPLYPGERKYLMLQVALRHDIGEGSEIPCGRAVGDIPAPTKRVTPEVKVLFDKYEDDVCAEVCLGMPDLTEDETRMLKFADNLSGLIYCVQERTLGHSAIVNVYNTYRDYIAATEMTPKEQALFDIVRFWWSETHGQR